MQTYVIGTDDDDSDLVVKVVDFGSLESTLKNIHGIPSQKFNELLGFGSVKNVFSDGHGDMSAVHVWEYEKFFGYKALDTKGNLIGLVFKNTMNSYEPWWMDKELSPSGYLVSDFPVGIGSAICKVEENAGIPIIELSELDDRIEVPDNRSQIEEALPFLLNRGDVTRDMLCEYGDFYMLEIMARLYHGRTVFVEQLALRLLINHRDTFNREKFDKACDDVKLLLIKE
ncbi:MAG: hypothetical protein UT66_C0023G0010 [candidate division CPR2 bacterium GW2011_GWC1_39_9]|nr:MAG: hypothetical protein UT66_C0023G0010 [candidate division CPR2 bacterium GW2011_GWC1_39_9]